MDDAEKAREYARIYRERNRELLRQKARDYWERTRDRRPPKQRPTPEERFWPKVQVGGPDECWEWQAGKSHGYGAFGIGGRSGGHTTAHRFSYELANGPVPEGMFVCHHCDNPPCVNPAHLYAGTSKDNVRDMVTRGRAKGGPKPGGKRPPGYNRKTREDDRRGGIRKFTDEQERQIAERYAAGGVSKSALAREHGVSQPTITAIVARVREANRELCCHNREGAPYYECVQGGCVFGQSAAW
jgi:hypothetical protein